MKPVAASPALAIEGGTPLRREPLPAWPQFSEDEVEAAASVLRSGKVNYWTGEQGREFEKEFAAFAGTKHAIAMSNGTVALEAALFALDIGPGDEVIVPSRTFLATASCVAMRGAQPVFADVDRDSGNLTAETVQPLLSARTRAILPVHLGGWPCDMDPLRELARGRGIRIVEDCAQAHGATLHGLPVGSLGDIGCFSFCQDKIISTGGEGGMLVTDDDRLWEKAWSFKDHGKSLEAVYRREHGPGFRWLHEGPGTNARLTEMQSAMGRILVGKIPERIAARRRNARTLDRELGKIPALRIAVPPAGFDHVYYRYHAFVRPEGLRPGWTRDRVQEAINAEGIPCLYGSCSEIYLEKAIPEAWRPKQRHPVARELGETSLMLPIHHLLSEADMADVAAAVAKVMAAAG